MKFFKLMALLLLPVFLAACTGKPEVTKVRGCSSTNPALCAERVTLKDKEGVSTHVYEEANNVVVNVQKINEATSSEHEMALTFVGAVAAPLANGVVAGVLRATAPDCGNNCPGSAPQVVVNTVATSGSTSTSTSGNQCAGYPYCTANTGGM